MDHEKLANLVQESRFVAAADNVIFPLIKLKIQQRIDLAVGKFNGGETNFISDIAYISGLKEIETQLKRLQTQGNQANFELNKELIK